MPWFDDSCLLHYLETVHIASDRNMTEFRFPVQMVVRPDLNFRGYAGQVASGVIKPGDAVMALPSGRISRVRSIVTYDGELPRAFPPMSVTLVLEDEIDISRGDMLVPPSHPPRVARKIDARMVWMQEQPLEPGREYLLKHTTQTLRATVEAVRYRVNIDTLDKEPAGSLGSERHRRGGHRDAQAAVFGSVPAEPRDRQFCSDRPHEQRHGGGGNDHWARAGWSGPGGDAGGRVRAAPHAGGAAVAGGTSRGDGLAGSGGSGVQAWSACCSMRAAWFTR